MATRRISGTDKIKASLDERLEQSKAVVLGSRVRPFGGLYKPVEQLVFTRQEVEDRYDQLQRTDE